MGHIAAELRRSVRRRASERCEYCGLAQEGQDAVFHIDHVVPEVAGGETTLENLALACVQCSLSKGARQTAIYPQSGQEVPLYSPRRDRFYEHYRWQGVELLALTATGRATLEALHLNRLTVLGIRQEGVVTGRHPPPEGWPEQDHDERYTGEPP